MINKKRLSALVLIFVSGYSFAQLPSAAGYAAAPDDWLLSKGPSWHHSTKTSDTPSKLIFREPTAKEKPIVERAEHLFKNSSAKSMALIDGNEVVWVGYKDNTDDKTTFMGFSIGKTITSMAVGKAICSNKLELTTTAEDVIPELKNTALGKSTVKNLLTMSSGTWEGNSDATITTDEEDENIAKGKLSILDILKSDRVSSAHKGFFGSVRKPGEEFVYRNTDPLVLGAMINKKTNTTFAKWVEKEVLLPAGIESHGIIGQDKYGFGNSGGGVRLTLNDWIRFAIWVKKNERVDDCFGNYVKQASKTQIDNNTKRIGKLFDGYGYFIWTENSRLKNSYWASGHGGQRIGWNHKNDKIIVVFSNLENYMDDLYWLYKDWANVSK